MSKDSKLLIWLGCFLILIVGAIHVIDARDSFSDATYKGWLFYINGFLSLIAVISIYYNRHWGWNLGMIISVGSLIGYVLSRTVGLPYIPAEPDAWLEPLGITSLSAEGFFITIFIVKRIIKQ